MKKIKTNIEKVKGSPIEDRVLVKQMDAEYKTAGGIIIPDSAKEKPQRGVIVSVGKNKDGSALQVQAGDIILFGKYSGTEIEIEGREYLIMKQADILYNLSR
jgi:chaperonin GroES